MSTSGTERRKDFNGKSSREIYFRRELDSWPTISRKYFKEKLSAVLTKAYYTRF